MGRPAAAAAGALAMGAALLWPVARSVGATASSSGERLVAELGCAGCHTGVPAPPSGRPDATELGGVGRARDAAWLFAYLAPDSGSAGAAGATHVPDFRLGEAERLALTLHLSTLRDAPAAGAPRGRADASSRAARAAFDDARERHPDVDAALGERIFVALDCAACHAHPTAPPRRNAPDLSREAARVRPGWLAAWLRSPTPIRPFGAEPGTGGRMPDFRLSGEQADSIATYLLRLGGADPAAPAVPARATGARGDSTVRTLSAFDMLKAEALLRDRLPCLGCHRLDGEGGRIGPDLSALGERLRPEFVRAMVDAPQRTVPGTIMPRTPLDQETRELIVAYLLEREPRAGTGAYLSLVEHPLRSRAATPEAGAAQAGGDGPADERGEALYGRYCAACHGERGGGDGFNARYVGAAPTAHAAAGYMSRRPDDTLFDGIFAGGRILNRSHRMPAFGETLSRPQIRSLVRYIRTLCACEGPEWSRDGRRTPGRPAGRAGIGEATHGSS